MIFLTHSAYDDCTIGGAYGAPEYSYHFVRKGFEPVLDRLGRRIALADPLREAGPIHAEAAARGEPCVLLSFWPPHLTPVGAACPTVPVFAWEYDTIPEESWTADPRHDWRYVFARSAAALTLCSAAAEATRRSMGADYPIWVAPTPVFDRFAARGAAIGGRRAKFDLLLEGALVIDAGQVDLTAFSPCRSVLDAMRALQIVRLANPRPRPLTLEGVVYTSVLSPRDGRKNWKDMVAGFVLAFRDKPDATLILKLTQVAADEAMVPILQLLSRLGRFRCRIVLAHGLLSDDAYGALIDATTYAVNTSTGEGQCLPLVEYMACGRPAVAPHHTAMLDYLSPHNAFLIASHERAAIWPHDDRSLNSGRKHLISLESLVRAYRESYAAAADPGRYGAMAAAAVEAVRAYCSEAVVADRVSEMMRWLAAAAARPRSVA